MSIFLKILYILLIFIGGFIALITLTDFKYKFREYMENRSKKLADKLVILERDFQNLEREVFEKDFYIITKFMSKQVSKGRTPVIELHFENEKIVYRIVGYKHHVSFVRCTIKENQEESDEKYIERKPPKRTFSCQKWHFKKTKVMVELEESEKMDYNSLEELFCADLVDGICLERDWNKLVFWSMGIGIEDQPKKNDNV